MTKMTKWMPLTKEMLDDGIIGKKVRFIDNELNNSEIQKDMLNEPQIVCNEDYPEWMDHICEPEGGLENDNTQN